MRETFTLASARIKRLIVTDEHNLIHRWTHILTPQKSWGFTAVFFRAPAK